MGSAKSTFERVVTPGLLLTLVGLQVVDLHSSLTAKSGTEANHWVNLAASRFGPMFGLLAAKVCATLAVAGMYRVFRTRPHLRAEVMWYAGIAVAFYGVAVVCNYQGGF